MDELVAVAKVLYERNPGYYGNVFGADEDARAAIAALDGYRWEEWNAILQRTHHKGHTEGREAGLREAAAAVERMRPAATPTWILHRMAREILALIDAGSPTESDNG